jgi:hypothetical protein
LAVIDGRDDGEQSMAMADRRHAELAQILTRQPSQGFPINVVATERSPILVEPEPV